MKYGVFKVFMTRHLVVLAAFCGLLQGVHSALAANEHVPALRLFGTMEFRASSLAALPQWLRVLGSIDQERELYAKCDKDIDACVSPALAAWRAKIRGLKGLDRKTQLIESNKFLNRWIYREDQANYGVADYWASPLEFLKSSGDCEDYAIIKYVMLRELGFSAEMLRIVVVHDTLRNVTHALLAIYLDDEIVMMDSLFDGVLPQKYLSFYIPEYSLNETSRWSHILPMSSALDSSPGVVNE